ncbi:MAG TPA: hypothetical protein VMU13_02265 [Candidatus Paceibacterota bacterium]|nr:hypothetical protein [Candidatus Paceibacterota bacterium]
MVDETNTTIGDNNEHTETARLDALVEPATPVVDPGAIPPPPTTPSMSQPFDMHSKEEDTNIHNDETEYERIQRLKLNTDDAPHSGAIGDDIQKILAGSKLPERRDFKATADVPTPIPTVSGVSITPPPPAEKSTTPAKPQQRDIVTALHTLKDDLQDIVLARKMSLVRASSLEQDKKREQPRIIAATQTPAATQRARRTFSFIFFAILLIAIGLSALYGVTFVTQSKTTEPAAQYPSLIFAEKTALLPLANTTPATLKETIAHAGNQTQMPIGSITRIIPIFATSTNAAIPGSSATLQQFLTALGIQSPDLPSELLQGLGTTFFFGIDTVDINDPVFVIPVTSYSLAFDGMLKWEPLMDQDLAPIFTAVPALVTGSDGLPTKRTFSDAVILNYDVRELKDDGGNVVLYYSFPTPNILIIAESVHSFPELLTRLEAQREL